VCAARSPEERALIARIGSAYQKAKHPDYAALTANARAGLRGKFEREARELTPDASPEQISRAADELHRAHMLQMTLRAKQARRKARENIAAAEAAETELAQLGGA
jgi:cellobiose-specific phosphotransferase system component IIA